MSVRKLSSFEQKLNDWTTKHLTRVPFVHKILFVHNLHIMIKAGLSLVEGLKILSLQVENQKLRTAIGEIKEQIEKGRQLSEVLVDYPHIFPPIYVSMIAAGEISGKMEGALSQVNNQMKKSHEFSARIHGALIYPAVVLAAMGAIAIQMVVFVLPKLLVMFEDFGAELPLPTRVLIVVVNFTHTHGLAILISAIIIIAASIRLMREARVKRIVHTINLRLPIFGKVIKKVNLARFTLTLSSLLQSAVPIIEAVRITANVQSNVCYREDLVVVAETLKRGEPLSEALGRTPDHFPPMVVQMIMIGEQSGQVEQMLLELSSYYESEVDNTMKNFSTLIEPVIILALGLGVAGIAVAVIMPIYSLAQSF